jgi:phenylpropionate dioxygenase-like ring-hydroxylating dioxygenase large terminal subunit
MRYFDETGFLDRGVYVSRELSELELERIFRRCWLLLGP